MLAHRFSRRNLTDIASLVVELRDGTWLANVAIRPAADEAEVRRAAAPIALEVTLREPVRAIRVERAATDRESAHRALTPTGTPIPLAALRGGLRRASDTDDCNFLVERSGHLAPVVLWPSTTPAHLTPSCPRPSPKTCHNSKLLCDVSGCRRMNQPEPSASVDLGGCRSTYR